MKYIIINILNNELKCIEKDGELYYPYKELSLLFKKEYLIHKTTLNNNYKEYLYLEPYTNTKFKTYINKKGIVEILTKGISYDKEYEIFINQIYEYFNVRTPKEPHTIKLLEFDIKYINQDDKIWWSLSDIDNKIFQKEKALSFNKYKKVDKSIHFIKIDEFIRGQYFKCNYIDEYIFKELLLVIYHSSKFKNRFEYQKINVIRLLQHFNILKSNDSEINMEEQTTFVGKYIELIPIYVKHIIKRNSYSNFDNYFDDLIQEGYLVLITSYRKYNAGELEIGDKFKGYLYKMIHVKMTEYCNKMKYLSGIHESRNIKTKLSNANLLIEKVYENNSEVINLKEACIRLNYSNDDIKSINTLNNVGSSFKYIEKYYDEDSERNSFYEKTGNIDKEYQNIEDKLIINKLLSFLSKEQLNITQDYHYKNMSYLQIANKYNIAMHQVKKVIDDSITIMRGSI